MPLFQQSVLKKYIADLDKAKVAAAWQQFQAHFHNPHIQQNIRSAKEEQYQEGFLRELFVQVLGYTLNPQPDFNLTTEYKNEKDSKKADGAVLLNGAVRAVIELKGTDTTDLSRIETQAFSYLHNHKGCTYVITSNFEKLRFYISDATDWQEFNLFQLTEADFSLLYLCLHHESLLADLPLLVKQQSGAQEDAITKKLYADYSRFKMALFEDLSARNPGLDRLELFRKTQKLLDRFLFILFAEDRLLLPPNFIVKIVEDWKQLQKLRIRQSLYDRFKLYFNDLLLGNSQEDIFAYNGGLFEPDSLLDNLQVNDSLLMEGVLTLSRYDYNTEVDVNILGHIFEHSLNEIEELQATIEGKAVDKGKTKRKKDGVFYTPRYITRYMVENTVGALCAQKKEALKIVEEEYVPGRNKGSRKSLIEKVDAYRSWLLELTICDPACGSGAFLNAALEFLIAEHHYIDELTNKVMGSSLDFRWTPNDILENNLYGVDINEEAVEIARLSLWLRTAQKGRKLSNLSRNIKCGNSLIDDPAVAGDKAFDWQKEFETIFEKGGFDVMIGNPPYGAKLSELEKNYFDYTYITTQYNYDTYKFFFEKSIELLKQNGCLGFITPNTFLVLERGDLLRKYLFENNTIISLLETFNVFGDAVVEPIITILRKIHTPDYTFKTILNDRSSGRIFTDISGMRVIHFKKESLFEREGFILNYRATQEEREIAKKIADKSVKLSSLAFVTTGIKPYQVGKGNPRQTKDIVENKPFTSFLKTDESWKPLIRGTQVLRYKLLWDGEFIKYGPWLAEPRSQEIFFEEKIFIRRTDDKLFTVFDNSQMIGLNSIHSIQPRNKELNCKFLMAVLNSKLLTWYFQYENFHMVGKPLAEVKVVFVERLPISLPEDQQLFVRKAELMLAKNQELNKCKISMIEFIKAKYGLLESTSKLADWPSLSFKEFLKELEKQKVKLSLSEQSEWMQYFEAEKAKANQIQQLIDKTDKEIDAMVYQLYGLTEDEIAIVEGNNPPG